jgi:hypothetical protein
MRPDSRRRILGVLVALALVVAFSAIDYAIRPHLVDYVGDNDVYVFVIFLAAEFIVIWRAVAMVSSGPRPTPL